MFVLLVVHNRYGTWEGLALKFYVNHTCWMTVVAPADRPKSVRNRCVIELYCSGFVLLWLYKKWIFWRSRFNYALHLCRSSCGIYGKVAVLFFSTIPQCVVLVTITMLYFLTWYTIHQSSKRVGIATRGSKNTRSASFNAAKTMTLFVVMFVVQYWASGIYAVWRAVIWTEPHIAALYPVFIFTNIGGVLNGIVYVTIVKGENRSNTTARTTVGDKTISYRIT